MQIPQLVKIKKCRISNSANLVKILDLGRQPLANALKKNEGDDEDRFPLSLSFCPESSLLQLNETIDKKKLFEQYVWITGTSKAITKYAAVFADKIISAVDIKDDDFIVEIASNDGTFLRAFQDKGFRNVLGVDPAQNIVADANKKGIRSLAEFWTSALARELSVQYGHAKIVIARNVVPHVSELTDVVIGIREILRDDGIGIIEFHDAGRIQDELHYDSIYHEHLCYFSIQSISYLLGQHELYPFHIEKSNVSGGSWVIYFSRDKKKKNNDLGDAIESEKEKKVNELSTWQKFAERSLEHRKKTVDIISSLKGKNIIGFGSSARSQTYLNFSGISKDDVTAIIDNNPLKQGLFTPGASIPIVDIDSGLKLKPDLIFILAWNFRDEIAGECLNSGYRGKFLLPFPNEPHFINENEIY